MNNIMNPEPTSTDQKLPPPIATQEQKLQSRRKIEETEFINKRPDILASKDGVGLGIIMLLNNQLIAINTEIILKTRNERTFFIC